MKTTNLVIPERRRPLEDPLLHLPCTKILAYKNGEVIYKHDEHGPRLYLIVNGTVKISRLTEAGSRVVIDVYRQDEFFGELAFLPDGARGEATALQYTETMNWAATEVEDFIVQLPLLGIALIQI